MSLVSIIEAANLVGKDRKTIYRHIAAGRLSATVNENGEKQVDIAELTRVYGKLRHIKASGTFSAVPPVETEQTIVLTVEEFKHLVALEAENAVLKASLEDMRGMMRLLANHQPPAPPVRFWNRPIW